ncbi:hypothetical protein D3C87_1743690 [compost metagenome]
MRTALRGFLVTPEAAGIAPVGDLEIHLLRMDGTDRRIAFDAHLRPVGEDRHLIAAVHISVHERRICRECHRILNGGHRVPHCRRQSCYTNPWTKKRRFWVRAQNDHTSTSGKGLAVNRILSPIHAPRMVNLRWTFRISTRSTGL